MPKDISRVATAALLLLAFGRDVLPAPVAERPTPARFGISVWQTEEGLPQHSVLAMTQTRDGYLWLGTLNGLVRFDGMRFTVFDENNTPGLNSSRIVYLFEDSQGNLWIGTETAGVFLARKNQPVIGLDIGRGSGEGRLMAAVEDSSGAVWLYTADGQLCRYQDGKTVLCNKEDRLSRLSRHRSLMAGPLKSVIERFTEESGHIFVGTDQAISVVAMDKQSGPEKISIKPQIDFLKLDFVLPSRRGGYWILGNMRIQRWTATGAKDLGPYPWRGAPVSSACEDTEGNLVVGTSGAGIFWLEGTTNVTRLGTAEGLSNDFIPSLHMDREGTLWVGTDGGGLNRVKRQVFDVLAETQGKTVQSVSADGQGGLWIGYHSGGLDHWRQENTEHYGAEQGWFMLPVRALVDGKQRVWAGTSGARFGAGLFQLASGRFERVMTRSFANVEVSALFENRNGQLLVGSTTGLLRRDGDGQNEGPREALSADVRAIAEDNQGNLWIGTRGMGLIRLHDGKWTRYSTREGLVSNSIGYLLEDSQRYLWMGSYAGLMRVSKKDLNDFAHGKIKSVPIRDYGKADGLPSGECTSGSQPAASRTPDGRLWFPTIKGLAYVDEPQLHPNTNPPLVMIESVLIEGESQQINHIRKSALESVTVLPGRERVEIHYTSLNLGAAERARFRYRLEGHETAWTEAGSTRLVRYNKLPDGNYRFQVTACNEDGVWNPAGASFALIVQPPFWRTWWFQTATALALLGAVIAMVRYFSVQKLERQLAAAREREAVEKERARIARDIHDQLGANLTQLALLGEMVEDDKNLPNEVQAHAQQICQAARETTNSLDEIVWTVNPANDTLEGLVNYICKYAQDYLAVAGLRSRLELPTQLPNTPIAPEVRHNVFLAAKEALTNVVRHAGASSVWIRLHLQPNRLALEISDDGKGLASMDEKRAATRSGLRNMAHRMREIGGEFEMDPAPEGGVRIRLIIPIETNRNLNPGP